MKEKQYKTLNDKANKSGKNFSKIAAYVVDKHCTNVDGTKLIGEDRSGLIKGISCDMAFGSLYTRNGYISLGVFCGVAACTAGYVAYKKLSKKGEKHEEV